jgi:hypothetical protein
MDKKRISKQYRYMVRAAADVFTLNFDFSPANVEGVFKVSFDHQTRRLLLKHARLVTVEFALLVDLH